MNTNSQNSSVSAQSEERFPSTSPNSEHETQQGTKRKLSHSIQEEHSFEELQIIGLQLEDSEPKIKPQQILTQQNTLGRYSKGLFDFRNKANRNRYHSKNLGKY